MCWSNINNAVIMIENSVVKADAGDVVVVVVVVIVVVVVVAVVVVVDRLEFRGGFAVVVKSAGHTKLKSASVPLETNGTKPVTNPFILCKIQSWNSETRVKA